MEVTGRTVFQRRSSSSRSLTTVPALVFFGGPDVVGRGVDDSPATLASHRRLCLFRRRAQTPNRPTERRAALFL